LELGALGGLKETSEIVNGLGAAVALDGLTNDEQSIFDF